LKRSPGTRHKGWDRGCGIVILVVLALVALAAILIGLSVGEAKRIEQTLNERCGEAPDFVPAPDGSIPRERVEAFLRVRARVYEHCPAIQERLGILVRLDNLDRPENVPTTVAIRERFGGLKELFSFGPAFLRFMEARNQALLDEEMGLGEYMYIYVLANLEQLHELDDSGFADIEQAHIGNRAREELTQILRNQLDAFESAEARPADEDLAANLRDQIAGLAAGQQALPWEDGLPSMIADSLEPYAESLAQHYCKGIAKIELMQKNKGLNFKN